MKNKFIFLMLGLLLISFASAWSSTIFNNSLGTENLTFTGNENYTRWLSIPKGITITSAVMNLSGYIWDFVVNSYECDATIINCDDAVDRNWTTGAYAPTIGGNGNISINYTSIPSSENINFTFKITAWTAGEHVILYCFNYSSSSYIQLVDKTNLGAGFSNHTEIIPSNCLVNDNLDLKIYLKSNQNAARFYEGEISWTGNQYLNNPYIKINNTQIWNHTGQFNSTFSPNKTDDFTSTLNTALNDGACDCANCSISGNYCLVPFTFHSDTAGILEYFGLIFNNDGFIENSQTYNNPVIGLNIENFSINITYDSEEFTNAFGYLIYNGTSYSATKSGSGNTVIFNKNIQIPQVTTQENATFYWNIVLNNGTNNYYNSTLNNQTINVLGIDDCSVYTYGLSNINLFDEEDKTTLLGDIEINYEILNILYTRSNFINLTITNVSNVNLCSNINLTDSNFLQSVEIRYVSDGYAPELYHIQRAVITEDNYTINLYDLNSSSSTEFKITYQDDTFKFVEGAVLQLLRKYIAEDAYEVVEAPLTSSQGIAVVHVDLNAIKYKVIVVKNGVILDIFPNIVFKCQSELTGECEQKLLGEIDPQNDVSVTTLRDFSYSISETNNTITTIFSIPSGVPSLVNILLSQTDQFGNTTLCNKSLTSSAGSIECDYLDTIGDSVLVLNIYKDGEPIAIRSYLIPEVGGLDFLDNNFFIVFILLLSIVGMAISSPEWIILNSVITLFLAGSLYLLNGLNFVMGFGALMWLVIAAAILLFKLAKQEDR